MKSKRETALELIDCLMKQFYLNNYTNDIDLIFRFFFLVYFLI